MPQVDRNQDTQQGLKEQPFRVESLTIDQIVANPRVFASYDDPHQYFTDYDPNWIEMISTNPYAKGSDLAVVFAVDNNCVVGRLGVYASQVNMGQGPVRTASLAAFGLEASYKASGAGGIMLLRALARHRCAVGCGGPDAAAYQLYKAVGFQELGPLRRFLFFYKSSAVVDKVLGSHRFAAQASALSAPLLKAFHFYQLGRRKFSHSFTYRQVNEFDEELDAVLVRERRNHLPRDTKTLNWSLQNFQFRAYQIYEQDRLLGYVLLKCARIGRLTAGYLVDYFLSDPSKAARLDLLRFAIGAFADQNIDYFECQMIDETMVAACRQCGLYEKEGNKIFFRHEKPKTTIAGTWFLSLASADMLQYLGSLETHA